MLHTKQTPQLILIALAAIALGAACVPAPRAPIDLQRVETKVVHFGLKHARSTICPGEPVSLSVMLDVVENGSGDHIRLVPTREVIDDYIFNVRQLNLSSPQGTFDQNGTFFPSPDVQASVHTGFVLYARAPKGPAFSVRFPPSYECTSQIGGAGVAGAMGRDAGETLLVETDEAPTPSTPPSPTSFSPITGFANGAKGPQPVASGRPGQAGGEGTEGPNITVFVTWVRTPDYTKLLAARAAGDFDHITLAAPGTPLEVYARGGQGGPGGRGGMGSSGVDVRGGGPGGPGGRGGRGGKGGSLHVVIDERFSEIETFITTDVSGGRGGPGGGGGVGGVGTTGDHRIGEGRLAPQGPGGVHGGTGPAGPMGRVSIAYGDVRPRFQGLGSIVAF